MKLDIKTAIVLGTLLFTIAGFYFTTTSDINSLSLQIKGVQTENRDMRKRLNATDKKISRLNKKLRELSK